MIELLSKIFIKNRDDPTSPETRRAYGTLCGAVGIAFNILLSIAKLIGASLTGSVSVAADAEAIVFMKSLLFMRNIY